MRIRCPCFRLSGIFRGIFGAFLTWIVVVFLCARVHSFGIHPENCQWFMKIVNRHNISVVQSFILPGDSYFIRIQVQCNSKINTEVSRYLALIGIAPKVHIESKAFIPLDNGYYISNYVDTIQTAVVDLGWLENCNCFLTQSRCYCVDKPATCLSTDHVITTNCSDCMKLDCTATIQLCNPVWLAPLPRRDWTASLHCSIESLGIGPYLGSTSTVYHVDGFHDNQQVNIIGSSAISLPKILHSVPLNCLPQHSPACLVSGMAKSNVALYSTTEFADIDIIEVSDIFNGSSVCSEVFPSLDVIKNSISILDTIIVNTPVGLIEIKGDLKSPLASSSGTKRNVLRSCIKHLVVPSAVHSQVSKVLAVGDTPHQDKLFTSYVVSGKSIAFEELLDSNHTDVCRFVNNHLNTEIVSCVIVTASVGSDAEGTVLVLVEVNDALSSSQYHIIRYEVSDNNRHWILVYSIPSQLPASHGHQEDVFIIDQSFNPSNNTMQQPVLIGMSHTAIIENDVFLWGNVLLYSPHGGLSLQRLTSFPSSSNITIFTSSTDGTYAFLTDTNELWVGVIGTAVLSKIDTSIPNLWQQRSLVDIHDNMTILTMFFDSLGKLQQVITDADQDCVSRLQIPFQDIVTLQEYHKTRHTNWKNTNLPSLNNTSCPTPNNKEMNKPPMDYWERQCPFARIQATALHSVVHGRKLHYMSKPPGIQNATLQHLAHELSQHFSRGSDAAMFLTVEDKIGSSLPAEVSLQRSGSYSFELYLYLEYEDAVDTSPHSWTLDHLHVSFYVSDPTVINVTSYREELIPFNAVKYQVTVQDKGVRFTQYPPGESLVPVSLMLHVWGSGFSCLENSDSGLDAVKSTQVMTVYLGCPANRQVVFDGKLSMSANGQKQFCSEGETVPCFLYERVFYPLFNLVDMATGHVTSFLGQYTLKIVGGGLDLDTMRDYTPQEQQAFNFKMTGSTSSLIWAAKEKTLAIVPVFNRSTNGIQWLCGTESPCANVDPKFMDNAQFYFKVEFSNKGVGDTNCDYTIQFVIRVHGLPPGSLHPSSIIVLSCLGIIITIVITLFIFKRQDQKLLKQMKASISKAFRRKTILPEATDMPSETMGGIEMEKVQSTGNDIEHYKNRGVAWEHQNTSRETSVEA